MPRLHTRIPPTCVQIFFLFVIPDFELHEIVVLNYTSPLPKKNKNGDRPIESSKSHFVFEPHMTEFMGSVCLLA